MNSVLIDDEQANIENLRALLTRHCPQVTVMAGIRTLEEARVLIEQHRPDLLFLDIQMGDSTVFELLQNLTFTDFEVIFVTAYDHYGIQAVKYAALDYLLKPVDIQELKAAVAKVEKKIAAQARTSQLQFLLENHTGLFPKKIALPMHQEIRYVPVQDIIYCEADNTYTSFYLQQEVHLLVSRPLKEYADLLKPHGFIRTHQSYLVNPRFVKSWLKEDGGVLLLSTGKKIPVSKPNREAVKRELNPLF